MAVIGLIYNVYGTVGDHYYVKANCLTLPKDLPNKQHLSSFGISAEKGDLFVALCEKLQKLFARYWTISDIPFVTFNVVYCSPYLINHPQKTAIIVYFKHKYLTEFWSNFDIYSNLNLKQHYENDGIVVYIDRNTMLTGAATVIQWAMNPKQEEAIATNKPTLKQINNAWYKDVRLRTQLFSEAEAVINHFIITKELDVYIPDFTVVPIYRVRRYQKAYELINKLYTPAFIMTLPLTFNKEKYTILFPMPRIKNICMS